MTGDVTYGVISEVDIDTTARKDGGCGGEFNTVVKVVYSPDAEDAVTGGLGPAGCVVVVVIIVVVRVVAW